MISFYEELDKIEHCLSVNQETVGNIILLLSFYSDQLH